MSEKQASLFDNRTDPEANAVKNPRTPTDTQREAAKRALPKSGTARAMVLAHIIHTNGATDEEIVEALGMNPNTERPRRKELQEQGWIVDSGIRRRTSSGTSAIVWTLND